MPTLFGQTYSKRDLLDLVGDMSQVAAVRRAELVEGNERGSGLIEVFNASGLSFSVLPGRSLDIASAHYKGLPLCFRGNVGDIGPAFYEPQSDGWMRSFFGGLVTSCGLTFVGHAETDPEAENKELGLHGRIANIPAKGVLAEGNWEGEDYVIRVRGRMREAEVFATNLELTREISTTLGQKTIHIYDRIENLSVDPSPLMMVYHTNPGFPLLDEGARLIFNSKKSIEWGEGREVGSDAYQIALPPQNYVHDVAFVHYLQADENGNVQVGLINDKLNLGLTWSYPLEELPILNQWQHFHRGTYVTGIEPGNCSVLGRAWNRQHNTLQHIQPGEIREFHLSLTVLDGADEIGAFERNL